MDTTSPQGAKVSACDGSWCLQWDVQLYALCSGVHGGISVYMFVKDGAGSIVSYCVYIVE